MKVLKKIIKIALVIIITLVVLLAVYILIIRTIFAKNCVKDTLNALASGDYTDEFYYVDGNGTQLKNPDLSEIEYSTVMKSTIDVEDYDFSWNKPYATVKLSVKYPDVASMYTQKYSDTTTAYSKEEMAQALLDMLSDDANIIFKTEQIDAQIVQYKTKWYLVENDALQNVYTGGMMKLYQDTLEKIDKK